MTLLKVPIGLETISMDLLGESDEYMRWVEKYFEKETGNFITTQDMESYWAIYCKRMGWRNSEYDPARTRRTFDRCGFKAQPLDKHGRPKQAKVNGRARRGIRHAKYIGPKE